MDFYCDNKLNPNKMCEPYHKKVQKMLGKAKFCPINKNLQIMPLQVKP